MLETVYERQVRLLELVLLILFNEEIKVALLLVCISLLTLRLLLVQYVELIVLIHNILLVFNKDQVRVVQNQVYLVRLKGSNIALVVWNLFVNLVHQVVFYVVDQAFRKKTEIVLNNFKIQNFKALFLNYLTKLKNF